MENDGKERKSSKKFYWVKGYARTFCTPYEYEAEWYCQRYGYRERVTRVMEPFNLFNGRHKMPLHCKSIFGHEANPLDFDALERQAWGALRAVEIPVVIYLTGLASAVAAVTFVASSLRLDVTMMHYDRSSDKYFPQRFDFSGNKERDGICGQGLLRMNE